jgi:hypothetical protein
MERKYVGYMYQWLPRCIFTQEAEYLKRFLSSVDMTKDWSEEDFKTRWVWLLEESIKEE